MAESNATKPIDIPELKKLLPESYTLETGNGILKQQGVGMRMKELAAELNSTQSIYKRLLQLPALMLYNQSLIDRAENGCDYLQEQIINIMFAMSEIQVKYPSVQKPLSDKRMTEYEAIKNNLIEDKDNLLKFQMAHVELKGEVLRKLKSQIQDWRKLCKEASEKLTDRIIKQGYKLPEIFSQILAKHLECVGLNSIKPEQLKELNLKKNLSYAEKALACALREINFK